MSKTLQQIFTLNPITSNLGTDLMYFSESPYTAGSDAAMTYANFSAQFMKSISTVDVAHGGTGATSFTPFSVICAGTTSTGAFQNVTGLGTLGQILTSQGAGTLPSWQNASASVTSISAGTGITLAPNPIVSTGSVSLTVPVSAINGGTGQTTYTLGDMLYSNATNSLLRVPGNISSNKLFLSQTGTGLISSAPAWSLISVADVTGAANAPGNTNITSLTGLTGPIEQPTVIASNTGAIMLGFAYQSSAVNYINVFNAATGVYPFFISEGSDANIDFGIRSKGTGKINLVSTNLTNPITIFNGTLAQHATNLLFPNTASTRNVTFQDADGTLAFTSQLLSSPLTTKGDLWAWSTTNARLPVASGNGKILQVDSTASTGLSYSTATYPVTAGTSGNIIKSDGTNFVSGAPAQINTQLLTAGTTYTPTANTFLAKFELIGGGGRPRSSIFGRRGRGIYIIDSHCCANCNRYYI